MGQKKTPAASASDGMWVFIIGATIIVGLPLVIAATHLAVG
jgi:hypothetical protein